MTQWYLNHIQGVQLSHSPVGAGKSWQPWRNVRSLHDGLITVFGEIFQSSYSCYSWHSFRSSQHHRNVHHRINIWWFPPSPQWQFCSPLLGRLWLVQGHTRRQWSMVRYSKKYCLWIYRIWVWNLYDLGKAGKAMQAVNQTAWHCSQSACYVPGTVLSEMKKNQQFCS